MYYISTASDIPPKTFLDLSTFVYEEDMGKYDTVRVLQKWGYVSEDREVNERLFP